MSSPSDDPRWLCFILIASLFHFCRADIGAAATYTQPYTPTACYGNAANQFPKTNLFAAAGEGIWDNGAACGRQYLVRCINVAPSAGRCIDPRETIQVKIVDRAHSSASRPSRDGTTMVLSTTALQAIVIGSPASFNIEFQQ
ncbi:hypothetical protein U1Q18_018690 [Sarracenia purpurea var. burkii]